jgi:hypothetical protein
MLNYAEAVTYLVGRRLLDCSSVVDDDLTIVDISAKNYNFRISGRSCTGFVLKQTRSVHEVDTIAREGAVYDFLTSGAAGQDICRYLVKCYGYDRIHRVLVLELAEKSRPLSEHQLRTGKFSKGIAGEIGRALAILHRGTASRPGIGLTGLPPWVLSIHTPPLSTLREISGGNLELLRIIQGSNTFCHLLTNLQMKWCFNSVIHGDIKSNNCIVLSRRSRSPAQPQIKLIDWELAMYGDAAWDVGSMFQDYLATWIYFIPALGGSAGERFVEVTRYPLEKMQEAIRFFWTSYAKTHALSSFASDTLLLRAVSYCGARLIQTTYESGQNQSRLPGTAIYALQVSLNILERPLEALVHLLGLSLSNKTERPLEYNLPTAV